MFAARDVRVCVEFLVAPQRFRLRRASLNQPDGQHDVGRHLQDSLSHFSNVPTKWPVVRYVVYESDVRS